MIYLLFFLSGAAGLVYELVWVRQLTLVFGGTTYAITTVLVAFMGGLGLGSYLAGRICGRLLRPGRVYGLLEIGIGLYALLVPVLLSLAASLYRHVYSPSLATSILTLARLVVSAAILILPTILMGATLPILVRFATQRGQAPGESVGILYGVNAWGAVCGVMAAGFWSIPALGLTLSTRLAAATNIAIGLLAILLLGERTKSAPDAGRAEAHLPSRDGAPPVGSTARTAVMVGFALSGFAAMVYQISWTRALVLSVGSSTYSFTCILAAFILGLALGSLWASRRVERWPNRLLILGLLELAIGLVAILILPVHGRIPNLVRSLVGRYAGDYGTLVGWQFILIIGVTIIPTFLMGAIFPLATRILAAGRGDAGRATGRAYAVNTIGTILGSLLAGFVLIRSGALGVQGSIILASLLNAFVGWGIVLLSRPQPGLPLGRSAVLATGVLIAIPFLALISGRWDPRLMQSAPFFGRGTTPEMLRSRQFVYLADGVDMTVSVYHPAQEPDLLTLTVNGKPDASTRTEDMISQLLIGHLPALLAPSGTDVCVIGLGSGMTLSAAACRPSFERLDCVEISDEVIEGASFFQPFIRNVLSDDPRLRMIRADGRNYLQLTDRRYDLILSEPSNPWISGVANLFTREFFMVCRSRMRADGLLAIWLQGYSTSVTDFRMVARTLFGVFDDVSLWSLYAGDYLLIARNGSGPLALEDFLDRCDNPIARRDLYRVGLHRPAHLLGRYIASGPALRNWAGPGLLHADDNVRLEFSAPRNLYAGRIGLADELLKIQGSVLGEVFGIPAGQPPRELTEEIAGVVAARWAPIRANEALQDGDVPRALRVLLEAYRGDPTNSNVYTAIRGMRGQLAAAETDPDAAPELKSLLAEAAAARAPAILDRRGGDDMALLGILRYWADQARGQGRWAAAAAHLREARDIDPADPQIVIDLRDALGRANPPGEAAAPSDPAAQRRTHNTLR